MGRGGEVGGGGWGRGWGGVGVVRGAGARGIRRSVRVAGDREFVCFARGVRLGVCRLLLGFGFARRGGSGCTGKCCSDWRRLDARVDAGGAGAGGLWYCGNETRALFRLGLELKLPLLEASNGSVDGVLC